MSLLKNFNPEMSFWEANPSVNSIPEFDKLKSKVGKSKSSRILWAIAFLLDKGQDNMWRNVSEKDAKILIKDEYLKMKDFKFEDYEEQMNAYKRHLMTAAERSLLAWERKMEERDDFIKSTPYDLDTLPKLDLAAAKTIDLFKNFSKIKEDLERESADGKLRGGAQESASEQGLI